MLIVCQWFCSFLSPRKSFTNGPKIFIILLFKYSANNFSLIYYLDADKKQMDIAPTSRESSQLIQWDKIENFYFLNSNFKPLHHSGINEYLPHCRTQYVNVLGFLSQRGFSFSYELSIEDQVFSSLTSLRLVRRDPS